jgi:hypothetical protein
MASAACPRCVRNPDGGWSDEQGLGGVLTSAQSHYFRE